MIEQVAIFPIYYKTCSRCKKTLPSNKFSKQNSSKDGLQSQCKTCVVEYRRNIRAKNRATDIKYYYNHREEQKARSRMWQFTHKEHQYELVRTGNRRRKARLKENGGSFTDTQWKELMADYGNSCASCGNPKPYPEHIVPVCKGGSGNIDNIQPLCMKCNREKFTKSTDYRYDHILHTD